MPEPAGILVAQEKVSVMSVISLLARSGCAFAAAPLPTPEMVRDRLRTWLGSLSLAVLCLATASAQAQAPVKFQNPLLAPAWTVAAPETQGFDSAALAAVLEDIEARNVPFYGLMVFRHHTLVLESYRHPYDQNMPVDIKSCTKSILSAVVGIAIGEGKLTGVDAPVMPFFADRSGGAANDPRKSALRVEHLLTMSSGLAWNKREDPQRMGRAPDWIEYALAKSMAVAPGERFNYSEADVHLLSAILQRATGERTGDYAQRKLFAPIGMQATWFADPQGVSFGGFGLITTPRELARFGHLYLQQGQWEGRQVVPAAWVEASTRFQRASDSQSRPGYGYLWWRPAVGGYSAVGSGGKYVYVRPEDELVVVLNAGLNSEDMFEVIAKGVLPAIRSDSALPPDPQATARLDKAVRLLQSPPVQTIALPSMAQQVSGKSFQLTDENGRPQRIVLRFADTHEASLDFLGEDFAVGLDGRYRRSASRSSRGRWVTPDSFHVEQIRRDGTHGEIRLRFTADQLHVSEVDTASSAKRERVATPG